MDEKKKVKEEDMSPITLVELQKNTETGNVLEITTVTVENDAKEKKRSFSIDIVALDENRDNLIGKNEFINYFISQGISNEAARHIFAELDTNNDENVSPQEYTLWLDQVDHTKLQVLKQ
ncbi:hypothetical protein RFI_04650 [Reticulomyxa filosa]|uniref:EF-hand domain-containing protein n=1 Tax=Reticulomyxa filosa TaxID=46433 RepID=X6P2M4_RETFI|nr:hypothetical protein RFI_04650 [Reticulomyxa filosa]|eukprot:ETO32466.1 hypothetical protein RFI_04650 [Reticulomyxa filosa]